MCKFEKSSTDFIYIYKNIYTFIYIYEKIYIKDLVDWINSILDATEKKDLLPKFKLN